MIAIPPVRLMLASLPELPALSESVAYQLTGLLVVFVALAGIWGLLELSGAIFRRIAARQAAVVISSLPLPAPSPQSPPAAPASTDIPPLTCALIAATVHVASKGRARILSATPVEPDVVHAIIAAAVHCVFEGRARVVSVNPLHSDPSWAREGRRDIFSSHRIR
jgi:hypothetical protein